MASSVTRRQFMATAGAAVASGRLSVVRAADKSPNEKLNIAFVGVANKGRHNIDNLRGQNVVALCDVDANNLAAAAKDFPKATQHRDWRKMLDAEHKHIDAVVVSTPDHSHAGPTARAITLGKHVYCEKPLTHTVQEARTIARLAAKHKVVTQMGTQIHAESNYRRVVEIIQSGAIGQVRDVYTWCNKGWSDGRFEEADKPAYLDWDLWLGPAKKRSYCKGIHPFYWRCFWEYGSGTFGDMACHIMDLPFWALKLRYPTSVEAKGPPIHPDGAPKWVLARYEFPARGDLPAVNLHWSDGGKHHDLVNKIKDHEGKPLGAWDPAALFVGDKGMLAADYGRHQLLPKKEFEGFKPPAKSIPDSVGHWNEWVQACKTGKPTTCNFDYSGALTETVLLGVVAYRSGEKLQWDAKKLRVTNTTKAEEFLKQEYRKGWEVVGLS